MPAINAPVHVNNIFSSLFIRSSI
ncbi:uncharacterized protein METZ01_LOCUS156786 [marine metagenome]|uniref:Uncharacterized protein n=1 Tax=marine metagenome TaxID=408172 RepID=A0A382AS63_9ZZZZ